MPPFAKNTSGVKVPLSISITLCWLYFKECRYSWCPKTSCLHIQPRFLTCNSGLKIEYFIAEQLQEWLCLHIPAHFNNNNIDNDNTNTNTTTTTNNNSYNNNNNNNNNDDDDDYYLLLKTFLAVSLNERKTKIYYFSQHVFASPLTE